MASMNKISLFNYRHRLGDYTQLLYNKTHNKLPSKFCATNWNKIYGKIWSTLSRCLVILLFCTSCSTIKVNDNPRPVYAKNACLPNAISFQDAYKVHNAMSPNRWSRIFIYGHHAFTVYALEDKIWIYDVKNGSRLTNVKYEDRNDIQKYFTWVGNGLDYTKMTWITKL